MSQGSSYLHEKLVDEILIALGSFTWIKIWRNATGAAYRNGQLLHYGVRGSPDIEGILAPRGVYIGMECKTGASVQSPQQKAWEAMIKKFGGHYGVVRSVTEAIEFSIRAKALAG